MGDEGCKLPSAIPIESIYYSHQSLAVAFCARSPSPLGCGSIDGRHHRARPPCFPEALRRAERAQPTIPFRNGTSARGAS